MTLPWNFTGGRFTANVFAGLLGASVAGGTESFPSSFCHVGSRNWKTRHGSGAEIRRQVRGSSQSKLFLYLLPMTIPS